MSMLLFGIAAILIGIPSQKNNRKAIEGYVDIALNHDLAPPMAGSSWDNGSYKFTDIGNCDSLYAVRASYNEKEYLPTEQVVAPQAGVESVQVDLALTPPDCPVDDLGCRLDLQPIYFDFDKHEIRPDAEVELAKILQAMKTYPKLKIHIESHTDSRGDDNYNLQLSERRAKSTMKWLMDNGIDQSRLTAKGYGETQLINSCGNGVECSQEDHQLNRRSMFIIKN